MSDHDTHQRRAEDDPLRLLNGRLVALEQRYASLSGEFARLTAEVGLVKVEQLHLKELLAARLQVIEQGQAMHNTALEGIRRDIQAMAGDAEKSPAGRALSGEIAVVQQRLDTHSAKHNALKEWQDQVNGVISFLKWVGIAGIVAIVLWVMRLVALNGVN